MKNLILVSLILSTFAAQAQSSSTLANACNFDALPTSRVERSREMGPDGNIPRLRERCLQAGYTACEVNRSTNIRNIFGEYTGSTHYMIGTRTVALSNREVKTQLCTQAAVCKQRAVISTDEMASQYLAVVDRIDANYNCRL